MEVKVKLVGRIDCSHLGVLRQPIREPMVTPIMKESTDAMDNKPSVQGKAGVTISQAAVGNLANEKP